MKSLKGFTLIELLIVIAVLGVLASVVLVAIDPLAQLAKARNAGRKSDLRMIASALERYKITNGVYPIKAPPNDWCNTSTTANTYNCASNNPLQVLITSGELKLLPVDPQTNKTTGACGNSIGYIYYSNGVDYKILAYCSPEGPVAETFKTSDPFYDFRGNSWQVSSSGGGGF